MEDEALREAKDEAAEIAAIERLLAMNRKERRRRGFRYNIRQLKARLAYLETGPDLEKVWAQDDDG